MKIAGTAEQMREMSVTLTGPAEKDKKHLVCKVDITSVYNQYEQTMIIHQTYIYGYKSRNILILEI